MTDRLPAAVWILAVAGLLGATADALLLFAVLWLAGPQGWSGAETALVVVALRLPTLAGGLLGGRAVDRAGGRPALVASLAGRAVLMAAVAATAHGGTLPLAAVLAAGALAGALSPASYAAQRRLAPRLVPPGALARANAALAAGEQLPMLLGAALVAPALAVLGPGRAMLVPAAMLAAGAALALCVPRGDAEPTGEERGHDRRPRASRGVAAIVALSVAYYFVYGPFETVTPAFVREHLGGGGGLYGLLWLLFGAGALLTLPLAPALAARRPGLVNAVGAAAWGLVMLPLALVGAPWAAAAIFLAGGAVWGPYSAIEATALHRWTDRAQHGRVFGTQRALLQTAAPLGAAAGALALDHAGSGPILAASAAACTLAGLVACAVPSLRRRRA